MAPYNTSPGNSAVKRRATQPDPHANKPDGSGFRFHSFSSSLDGPKHRARYGPQVCPPDVQSWLPGREGAEPRGLPGGEAGGSSSRKRKERESDASSSRAGPSETAEETVEGITHDVKRLKEFCTESISVSKTTSLWSSSLRSVAGVPNPRPMPIRKLSSNRTPPALTPTALPGVAELSSSSYFPNSPLGNGTSPHGSSTHLRNSSLPQHNPSHHDTLHSAAAALALLANPPPSSRPSPFELPHSNSSNRLPPISSFSLSNPTSPNSTPPPHRLPSLPSRSGFGFQPNFALSSSSDTRPEAPFTLPPIQDNPEFRIPPLNPSHLQSQPSLPHHASNPLPTIQSLREAIPPTSSPPPTSASHLLSQLRRHSLPSSKLLSALESADAERGNGANGGGPSLNADSLMRRYSEMLKESLDSWEGLKDLVKDAEEVQCGWEGVRQSLFK